MVDDFQRDFPGLLAQRGQQTTHFRPQQFISGDLEATTALVHTLRHIIADDVQSASISDLIGACENVDQTSAVRVASVEAAVFGIAAGRCYTGVEPNVMASVRVHMAGTRLFVCARPFEIMALGNIGTLSGVTEWLEGLTPQILSGLAALPKSLLFAQVLSGDVMVLPPGYVYSEFVIGTDAFGIRVTDLHLDGASFDNFSFLAEKLVRTTQLS